MKKRTVLHILNGEVYSGVEQTVVTLCSQLDQSRYRPHVITLFDGLTAQRLKELGIGVDIVPMKSRWDLGIVRKIRRIGERVGASLIHVHTIRSHLVGSLAARGLRIPIVVHIQSATIQESERKFKNRWNAFLESWLHRWTDRYVTVADSLQLHLKEKGVPSNKIVTLYNAIDVSSVIEASKGMTPQIHDQLNLEAHYKLIGMVAFFRYRKGAEDLLQAVKLLGDGPVPYRVVMIGGGEPLPEGGTYLDLLKEHTEELNIDQRVIFVGFKENARQWMAGLDIFVLPSRFGEGLPLVVLEAMALNVPVIATPVEGTAEVLTEGINGLLPDANNPEALSEALRELLSDPGKGEQLASEAFRVVRGRHDAPVQAQKMADIYDDVLA